MIKSYKAFIFSTLLSSCLVGGYIYAQSFSPIALIQTGQREMSALAVFTKQLSLSAQQEGVAAVFSGKQVVNAVSALQMHEKFVRVFEQFDPRFGQPRSILCEAQAQGNYTLSANDESQQSVARLMQNYSTQRVESPLEIEQNRLQTHEQLYCSLDEEKIGACKRIANGMQAWDSNYAGAFGESTASPESELAGYAYTQMIVDHRPSAAVDCTTIACSAASSRQLRRMSLSSAVATVYTSQMADRRVPLHGQ